MRPTTTNRDGSNLSEHGNRLFGEAVREVITGRIPAEILEREDGESDGAPLLHDVDRRPEPIPLAG